MGAINIAIDEIRWLIGLSDAGGYTAWDCEVKHLGFAGGVRV